jgi:hypothetical protein
MEVIDHESPPRCELMQPGLQPVCGAWAPIERVAMRTWRVENLAVPVASFSNPSTAAGPRASQRAPLIRSRTTTHRATLEH